MRQTAWTVKQDENLQTVLHTRGKQRILTFHTKQEEQTSANKGIILALQTVHACYSVIATKL